MAKAFLEVAPDNQKETARRNVEALEAVQPQDLGAGEIGVRIGANWVPIEVYQQFMVELLTPNYYVRDRIKILRSEATGQWSIREKNADRSNVKAITTYGTKRMSAYHILEQTLNQRDVRVFDYVQAGKGALHRPPEGAGCDPRPPYLAGRHFFDRKQVLQNLSVQRHQLSGGKPRG